MVNQKLQLPEGIPPLTTYYIYLTAGCNLACQHCWIAPKYQASGGTGGHLDINLLSLAIEEGIPLGLKNVKLTGGEPLLHPDFIRICEFLREKELGLTIESNGVLLTKSIATYLKEKSTLTYISISLDGANARTHDAFRGVKGSFEKTVRGIEYLVKVGIKPQIIMSIHKGNVNEIEPLVYLAEKIGADSVKFNLINPSGRGELMNERDQTLNISDLIDTGKWIESVLQEKVSIPLYYSWPVAFEGIKQILSAPLKTCNIAGILGILPDGQVAMCGIGTNIQELCYGQIGQNTIKSIWLENPTINKLRQKFSRNLEGICGDCIFRDVCLGNCVAENYSSSGGLTAPFWFCQQAEDAHLFPVTRRRN